MKTVYDLSANELNELKESYFCQINEASENEVLDEIKDFEQIPDNVIFNHYAEVSFKEGRI